MLLLLYGLFLIIVAGYLIIGAGYLVVGLGYVLYAAAVAAGWVLFIAGWLIWHTARLSYRLLDWTVDKCAPPIAARWHRWRDSRAVTTRLTAERRPPVKEIGVVHWGYGHLDLARRQVRELPPRKSRAVARRWSPDRVGPRRRSLRG